ncbi:Sorting nexin-12 [Neolecta irregularis DAH-3]|uniref:Sorting nexin-12 n=1 Tax=Neolecta irregularis (strain DAH-3) TaxID=1198029 RepID=A0A1U7LK78_NEOID|nr:Sorting nexin-12 [Neolecta irregularis DAH-3]|eukprot:OLL23057.1 Sorting nexin-12 [Neolecta irregularis DAH-3]
MPVLGLQLFFFSFSLSVLIGAAIRYIGWIQYVVLAGLTLSTALWLFGGPFSRRRDEKGISKAYRSSNGFKFAKCWNHTADIYRREKNVTKMAAIYSSSPPISEAIDVVLGHIMHDFVLSWSKEISPNPSFSNVIERTIRHSCIELRTRILHLDVSDVIVKRLVPIVTHHIHSFSEAERSVFGKEGSRQVFSQTDELALAVATAYKDGVLHPGVTSYSTDAKLGSHEWLRKTTAQFLPYLLPGNEASSRIVFTLVREIISHAVILPVIELLSEPDTWNVLIEQKASAMLQEKRTVKKFREALDKHTENNMRNSALNLGLVNLSEASDEKGYLKLLHNIRHWGNLVELRRLHSDVVFKLQELDAENGKRKEKTSRKTSMVTRQRLQSIRSQVDERISDFLGSQRGKETRSYVPASNLFNSMIDFKDILESPTGLSYFMEFMDRRKRVVLLQFWINVNSFKDPLEDYRHYEDPLLADSLVKMTSEDLDDLRRLYDLYFDNPLLEIDERNKQLVALVITARDPITPTAYRAARQVILGLQSSVFEGMKEIDFPKFKGEELYNKFIASESNGNTPVIEQPREFIEPAPPISVPINEQDLYSSTPKRSLDLGISYARTMLSPFNPEVHSSSSSSLSRLASKEEEMSAAVSAALTEILKISEKKNKKHGDLDYQSRSSSEFLDSRRSSLDLVPKLGDSDRPRLSGEKARPMATHKSLFSDDDPKSEDEFEEEYSTVGITDSLLEMSDVHHAAPGNLELAEAIEIMTREIKQFEHQERLLNSMIVKAELTNNVVELKILNKAITTVKADRFQREFQRQQYVIQEGDNALFGKSSLNIPNAAVGKDGGQEFAIYFIEVQRYDVDGNVVAGWMVKRRYSDFWSLHQRLKEDFIELREFEFPKRRVMLRLQKGFVESRRKNLEKYLQSLLQMPEVCRSKHLRSFLSQQNLVLPPVARSASGLQFSARHFIKRAYKTIAEGVEDTFGSLSLLDHVPINLSRISAGSDSHLKITNSMEMDDNQKVDYDDLNTFSKCVCDLILEVLDLNGKSGNWISRKGIVMLLQQFLGGTIERKVREHIYSTFEQDMILDMLKTLRKSIWPNGQFSKDNTIRTADQKVKSKNKACAMLTVLSPLPHPVSRRLFLVMQNRNLNSHLFFSLFEALLHEIFPEI